MALVSKRVLGKLSLLAALVLVTSRLGTERGQGRARVTERAQGLLWRCESSAHGSSVPSKRPLAQYSSQSQIIQVPLFAPDPNPTGHGLQHETPCLHTLHTPTQPRGRRMAWHGAGSTGPSLRTPTLTVSTGLLELLLTWEIMAS